jgi:CSLREA domain-containing protein
MLGVAAAVVLACAPSVAVAQQLPEVNTFDDDAEPPGCTEAHCTLRERINATEDVQTIQLQAGTYVLAQGPLNLDSFVIIDGVGARETTIDAEGTSRIAHLTNNATATVSKLTVTGGNANTQLNSAVGNGGAFRVETESELRLIETTLTGNVASATGGAVSSLGSLSFVESTASGNRAGSGPTPGRGGAVYSAGEAGDIFMLNSTISDNTAVPGDGPSQGGGIYTDDSFDLDHVTIASNSASEGGGLYQADPEPRPGFTDMFDTLIADNEGGACGGVVEGVEEDNNVADDGSCSLDPPSIEDPDAALLAPLDNYNGPTDTRALFVGNPAIGAARPDFCFGTDQRGVPRPEGGPCDVGAFEGSIEPGVRVSTTEDGNDGECDTDCTLREAVSLDDVEVVTLPPGRYELTLGALEPTTDKQIIGSDARTTIIDANGESRVAYVNEDFSLFHEVTLTGGNAGFDQPDDGEGGAIRVGFGGTLEVIRSTIAGNVARSNGGGISSIGELVVRQSTVSGNVAGDSTSPGFGGGIYATGANTSVENSTVSGNSATDGFGGLDGAGGGLYLPGNVSLQHVTISNNTATEGAGLTYAGVSDPDTLAFMNDTLLAGNLGTACGGNPSAIDDVENNVADDASCQLDATSIISADARKLAPLGDRGGQTDTHALYTGNPAIDASDACEDVDQRGVVRPQSGPCDAGAYEGSIDPPSSPPPASQGGGGGSTTTQASDEQQELPAPEAGETVNALPSRGTVRIRLPGTKKFVELEEGRQIPVGTVIDTTKGRVTLVAAGGQQATFYDGIFRIGQGKGAKPLTTLTLIEALSCPKAGKAVAAAKKKKRRLWGDGSGKFRTKGKHSAATVVGTKWLVEDRCTSTLTRVTQGRVSVRDFAKKKTVIVRAGKKYVARAKKK